MTEYRAKVAYWVRAFSDIDVEAENDTQAIEMMKQRALESLGTLALPLALDTSQKCDGEIAFIDRDGTEIAEAVSIDDPETTHPELRREIETLRAALSRIVAADNCNYSAGAMRHEGLFDDARAALGEPIKGQKGVIPND